MPTPAHATITVPLADRAYDVLVGAGLLDSLGERCAALFGQGRRAFLVFVAGLPDPLVIAASRSLAHHGFQVASASVRADEAHKSLGTLARLLVDIAETRHERTDPVVSLGGGVTGDLAGFLAATYRRGVPVVHCPTTLLSMVDASVGGKTGVNLLTDTGLKKNLVGAFWQPLLVLAYVASLATLPDRALRAGLAECFKHGMLGAMCDDESLFQWSTANLGAVLARDHAALIELVRRNVALKARVVVGDERESVGAGSAAPGSVQEAGGRALLNLGHTFAHAIEPIPTISPDSLPSNAPLQHGEAVALGLVAASVCAREAGLAPAAIHREVEAALRASGLPTAVRGLPDPAALLAAMGHDKKALGGRLRLVLPTGRGVARLVTEPATGAVEAGLAAIRAD